MNKNIPQSHNSEADRARQNTWWCFCEVIVGLNKRCALLIMSCYAFSSFFRDTLLQFLNVFSMLWILWKSIYCYCVEMEAEISEVGDKTNISAWLMLLVMGESTLTLFLYVIVFFHVSCIIIGTFTPDMYLFLQHVLRV